MPALITAGVASVVVVGAAVTSTVQWFTRPGKNEDAPDLKGLRAD